MGELRRDLAVRLAAYAAQGPDPAARRGAASLLQNAQLWRLVTVRRRSQGTPPQTWRASGYQLVLGTSGNGPEAVELEALGFCSWRLWSGHETLTSYHDDGCNKSSTCSAIDPFSVSP